MKISKIVPKLKFAYKLIFWFAFVPIHLFSQVQLRDTSITWLHHQFELNSDHSMKSFSTSDTDIQEVEFMNGKVIENDLIRLVVLPEYGARIISFYYKPSGHEYLYQSECGSPYGIGAGNFYYNWLMVYGGIFPTFPEPEHGKTWLLPWDYSVLKNNVDTVTIRMEYIDENEFSGAPSIFNNGITNLTCQIDISVYRNAAIWDFDVNIINNEPRNVNYEYWTCTTLTPGSDPGDTYSPLNSEIVVPVEQYFAGWSPGGWIGNYNVRYNMDDINFLHKWENMGIAYAYNLNDIYWGVINHENEEGIFRISENIDTKGMKLWTWGKNNVDNDMFDFSNGGADNYIELWGGVSDLFFQDDIISEFEQKNWTESYCATVGLSSISNINDKAGINILWDQSNLELSYELNTFHSNLEYTLDIYIDDVNRIDIASEDIFYQNDAITNYFMLEDLELLPKSYTVHFDLIDDLNNIVLKATEVLDIGTTSSFSEPKEDKNHLTVMRLSDLSVRISMAQNASYKLQVFNVNGQLMQINDFEGFTFDIQLPMPGLYVLHVSDGKSLSTKKIII